VLRRAAVPAVLLGVLLVAGCHAAPAASAPPSATTGTSADPLSDVEATVDAVEQDVDTEN
jgi:outer membrane murein-binding lipoprotein Lpp